jgi:hypothetical protein
MRWSLLKDRSRLSPEAAADLDTLIGRMSTLRTARAWLYKERLREILERKQINVVRAMLQARGLTRLSTIRTVIFLIAGKLDFRVINPHAGQPT